MTKFGEPPRKPRPDPPAKHVDCFRCRHLSITYRPDKPYACALFAMRSRLLPSIEVQRSSGSPCAGFEAKPGR